MPFLGPRLDRPSAVGDEGRPRATPLWAVTLIVGALGVGAGWYVPMWEPITQLAMGASLVAAGTALFDRDSIAAIAIGNLCFLPGGVVMMAGLVTATKVGQSGPAFGLLVFGFGFAVAMLGGAGAWANVDGDVLTRATKQGWGGLTAFILMMVGLVIVGGLGWLFVQHVVAPAITPRGGPNLSGLFLLVLLTSAVLRSATSRLPIAQLAPQTRRDDLAARVDTWQHRLTYLFLVSVIVWIVLAVLELFGLMEALYLSLPRSAVALLDGTASPFVRLPIVVPGALALVPLALAVVARRLTSEFSVRERRLYGPVVGAVSLLAFPTLGLLAILVHLGSRPLLSVAALFVLLFLSFVLVLAAVIFFLLPYTVGTIAVHANVLPDRAGSIALAAAGVLLSGTGLAIHGVPAPIVFACVAGAMVLWDVSAFGVGLTRELGHVPDVRRVSLLHATVSVVVAVVAVGFTTGLSYVQGLVAPSDPVLPVAVLAVAGVLVLLVPLRE
jgi:hypothetical protein